MEQQTKAVAKKPVDALKQMLEASSVKEQFENALGDSRKEFVASLIDLYSGDKSLQQCAPAAVVQQALKAAILKLPLVKAIGQSYVVVYNNKGIPTPTFIIGYKGLIQLAKRSGLYQCIHADVVYEGELLGADKLTGEINLQGKKTSNTPIGYFAYIREVSGFAKSYYMSIEDMVHYAKTYVPSLKNVTEENLMKAAKEDKVAKGVGWLANFRSMAVKTCLRQLIDKWGSLSIDIQNALIYDEGSREDAQAERDEMVEELTATEYVDLDAEAEQPAPAQEQQPAEEETPDY